ncbi:hypothetical protein CCAND38_310052 [Capnocytophaga canis]|uniref:Uncharacterized protein n=1 Tax=Capnocytophaga canis TaxID=1848903 RepID=A0A0B7I622_9FLAO|nr:hypothetical protein CCAND38_310052 [Capnocytophaga canis]
MQESTTLEDLQVKKLVLKKFANRISEYVKVKNEFQTHFSLFLFKAIQKKSFELNLICNNLN